MSSPICKGHSLKWLVGITVAWCLLYQPLPDWKLLTVVWVSGWGQFLLGFWLPKERISRFEECTIYAAVFIMGVCRFTTDTHLFLSHIAKALAAVLVVVGLPQVVDIRGFWRMPMPAQVWWLGTMSLAVIIMLILWMIY